MKTSHETQEMDSIASSERCTEHRTHVTSIQVFGALLLANFGKVLILGLPAVGTAAFGTFWLFSRASIFDVQKLQERTDKEMNALREQTQKVLQEQRDRTDRAIKRTNQAIQDLRVGLSDLRVQIRKDVGDLLKEAIEPLKERIRRNEQMLDATKKR